MRILQINATYKTGSTGEIIAWIAESAAKAGMETYYVCASLPEGQCSDKIYVMGNQLDHKIHAIESRLWGKQGSGSKIATAKMLKWVDKVRPDIIHLHNLHSNYINISMLFRYIQKRGIETVITLHDCWFFTGKCCHFLYDNCNRWKTGCGNCPRIRKEIPSYFHDRSAEVFAEKRKLIGENPYVHVVGCSDWITNLARQSLLRDRVEGTIHNGICVEVFLPQKSDLRMQLSIEGKYVLLGMANKWLAEENRETYNLFQKTLRADERLMLIGCTTDQLLSLPNRVIGVGFIRNREELARYYSLADVFVNVTKVDTFPTVNLEALGCGTPVVTYDSGGSAEVINDKIGRVVPYGDADALRKAVDEIRLMNSEEISAYCVQYVQKYYRKENRFTEYVELYQKIKSDG